MKIINKQQAIYHYLAREQEVYMSFGAVMMPVYTFKELLAHEGSFLVTCYAEAQTSGSEVLLTRRIVCTQK
jgi:hypothetical protein